MSAPGRRLTGRWDPLSLRFGLAAKLMLISAGVTLLVCATLMLQASTRMTATMRGAFTANGEALALSLASAAEQSAGGNIALLQSAIDSGQTLAHVRYIYIQESDGTIVAHTFVPTFPTGIEQHNPLEMGELSAGARVKVNPGLEFTAYGDPIRAIDVAAPISGGALGTVHVGMDLDAISTEVTSLRRALMLWAGLVLLVGVLLSYVAYNLMLLRPLRHLAHVTGRIVESNDLAQVVTVNSRDELGQLARSFAMMVEKLRQFQSSLRGSVGVLTESASRLDADTSEQSAMIHRQAAALQQTRVTIDEINQTSMMASGRANSILEVAVRADEVVRTGEDALQKTMGGLNDIQGVVQQMAEMVTQLGKRTAQIHGIAETVRELGAQSNMLAINAAIEAARAGESGRSFGVVAREIRALADQSMRETHRVTAILAEVSDTVAQAVKSSENGSVRLQVGLSQVAVSGDKLRELSSILTESTSGVRQIAAAVSQQSTGVNEIFTALKSLDAMMVETTPRVASTQKAASALKDLSVKVSELVSHYNA
ncbi:methyl-accepting chemotaxis protein [Pyxidicoccus xibeiensis]|uniref:methyl-accepting chemotaxis protein n=1 Tax=Pyxidicoccus xibeiensis TaxID=2906759 RepID=UPI0020A703D3|nr:methyl-accepting chemotaxis protein [Pyxidicoccus xibeiensis]MCP3141335.1 methyl-accepting chemotaxis protein [Pyxidicoccus xibeiensis]